ncbi:MAG: hypothetical protein AB4063_12765 [Crocosphaera sp.]
MTTEREYQEGQRRIKKHRVQHQRKNSLFPWIFMGMIVFIGLMVAQVYQNRSPQTTPTNSEQISS